MTFRKVTADVVIVGAGIAGLWLHHRLNQQGFNCVLLENQQIGHAQTLSAQGIIHGGSKYALNGILTGAAQAISAMPARWKACFDGTGEIDLSAVKLFTEHQLLWSTNSLSSKMVSFFASKALQSRMQSVPKAERSGIFADKHFKGSLYQLDEPVVDVHSLLRALISPYQDKILKTPVLPAQWQHQNGQIQFVQFGDVLSLAAQHFVLTAGEGTQALLNALNIKQPAMQRRALQMLLCKAADPKQSLPQIYAHSLGSGSKPIATISSHPDKTGNVVWYLGGNLAEEGVGKPANQLINEAKALLKQILPWVELPELQWTTLNVNRAEPRQSGLSRPDNAFVESRNNLHIAWPTKLALAPDLADRVIEALKTANLQPQPASDLDGLEKATLAQPLWDRAFNQ